MDLIGPDWLDWMLDRMVGGGGGEQVQALGNAPNSRFCHVACVYKDSMFVFGGYDGTSRLNDLVEFRWDNMALRLGEILERRGRGEGEIYLL